MIDTFLVQAESALLWLLVASQYVPCLTPQQLESCRGGAVPSSCVQITNLPSIEGSACCDAQLADGVSLHTTSKLAAHPIWRPMKKLPACLPAHTKAGIGTFQHKYSTGQLVDSQFLILPEQRPAVARTHNPSDMQ